MKRFSVLVTKVLMSTLTAGIFVFGFSSCTDDNDTLGGNGQQPIPPGAKTEMMEAYGLTFHNFIHDDDVTILNADTTQLSISKAYAEKMGIKSFVNHPMGIWHRPENLPYLRKCTGEMVVGDRIIIDVVNATVAEVVGEKAVNLKSDIYVNQDANAVKTRAAGDNIPEYAAKYVDNDNVIHPACVLLTDPYGYDKDYSTADDPVSETMTRAAAEGNYMYMTADEIAAGNTRWGCHNNIINFNNKLEKQFDFPIGKGSKDTLFVSFASEMEFALNYFITLDGGIHWDWCIPNPYLKKFEAGVDGNFHFKADIAAGWQKEWKLDPNEWRWELVKFRGYTFTFMVGPIPVAITTDPHLDFAVDGKVTGAVKMGFSYEYSNSFKGGFGYQDGRGFYAIKDFKEIKNKFDMDPLAIELEAKGGAGIFLCCDLKIYGLAGPKVGVGPRLGGELNVTLSPFKQEASFAAKIGMKASAVIGAKVEILGYELADATFTYDLTDEWILAAYNWELEGDEEIHKSPEEKKKADAKNLYQNVIKSFDVQDRTYDQYEKMVNMLIDMDGYDRQQAEDKIYEEMHRYVHDMEYQTDGDKLKPLLADAIARYFQQVSERYDAFLIEKSWQEVAAELRECPAYIENARLWRTYKMDINMDFLHRHFVSEMGREPAKTAADLEVLAYYVLTYSKLAYIYTPGYRSKFTGVVENLIKYGKSLGKYNDKQIEMAAYETLLEINMRYPATLFANLPWNSDSDDPRIPRLIQEYEYQLKRVKY